MFTWIVSDFSRIWSVALPVLCSITICGLVRTYRELRDFYSIITLLHPERQ